MENKYVVDELISLGYTKNILNKVFCYKMIYEGKEYLITKEYPYIRFRILNSKNEFENVEFRDFKFCDYVEDLCRKVKKEDDFDNHMKNVWKIDKFDLVCTNPPYQKATSKTHKLWVDFLDKSTKLSKKIIFITPTLLCSGRSKRITNLRKNVIPYLSYINLNNQDMFDISEKVCYYLIDFSNSQETKTKTVLDDSTTIYTKYDDIIYQNDYEKIKYSIINKVENMKNKIDWFSDIKNTDGKGAPKSLIDD